MSPSDNEGVITPERHDVGTNAGNYSGFRVKEKITSSFSRSFSLSPIYIYTYTHLYVYTIDSRTVGDVTTIPPRTKLHVYVGYLNKLTLLVQDS